MAKLDLQELQNVLDTALVSAQNEKEVRKGLTRIENLVSNITKEIENVYQLLDGATPTKKERKTKEAGEPVEVDPEAPFGRKKDGSPKVKPGRSKAE